MAEYINISSGFNITTTLPVDKRLVMTKAEMLAIKKPQMPDYYFVLCSDDQRLYIYDKSIETLDPVLGRFRPIENYFSFASEQAKAAIEAAITNSQTIIDLTAKVGDAEAGTGIAGQVKEVTNRVSALETSVSELEVKVGDEEKGLVKQVNELVIGVNDLEPRVAQAETDITAIETWINNVKLDGGEIKSYYELQPIYAFVTPDSSNPTTINYGSTANIIVTAATGYALPETVQVNTINVGSTEIDCGIVKAQWNKAEGKLILSNPKNNVGFKIVAVEA